MEGELGREAMCQTGPQVCCYCKKYFKHYFSLKCHVVKVHPANNEEFKRMPVEKFALPTKTIPTVAKQQIHARQKRTLARQRSKRNARQVRADGKSWMRVSSAHILPTKRSHLTAATTRLPVIQQVEPIGTLILCNMCGDKFYDPKYLRWHLKNKHDVNNPEGEPALQLGVLNPRDVNNKTLYSSNESLEKVDGIPEDRISRLDANQNAGMKSFQKNKIRGFKCDRCPKSFGDPISLKRHLSSHVKYKTCKCRRCGKNYFNRKSLEEHVAAVHQEAASDKMCQAAVLANSGNDFLQSEATQTSLQCFFCKKFYVNGRGLSYHIISVHKYVNSIECYYCKEIISVDEFAKHIVRHERPYQCNICDKKFRNMEEKLIHEGKHVSVGGSKKYNCEKCDKAYFHESSLDRHVKTSHRH